MKKNSLSVNMAYILIVCIVAHVFNMEVFGDEYIMVSFWVMTVGTCIFLITAIYESFKGE